MRKTRFILAGGSMIAVLIALVGLGLMTSPGVITSQEASAVRNHVPEALRPLAKAASEHYAAGEFEAAAQQYERLLEEDPKSVYAWSNLGVVRYQQKRYDEAVKALQKTLSISPKDAFTWSILGIVYYQTGELETAIEALERAKALDPQNAKTRNYLGVALAQMGWKERAQEELRRALELAPNYGDAKFNRELLDAPSEPHGPRAPLPRPLRKVPDNYYRY